MQQLVDQRVQEELERRKEEIEAEVLRRVEEAKRVLEQQLLEELERKKQEREEDERRKEVSSPEKASNNIVVCQRSTASNYTFP